MDYKEYKKASKRHLYTCQTLKKNLEKEGLSEEQKQHLLFNLYYLCGYIIECSLNFAILKFIDFERLARDNELQDRYGKADFKKLKPKHNDKRVGFRRRRNENRDSWYLYHAGHKFQDNIKFFREQRDLRSVKINKTFNALVDEAIDNELFNKWDVHYRYDTKGITLDMAEVFDLLELSKKIFIQLGKPQPFLNF